MTSIDVRVTIALQAKLAQVPLAQLEALGAQVFLVGGLVRILVFNSIHGTNLPFSDYDLLVTNLEQKRLTAVLAEQGKADLVGASFGVIKFRPRSVEGEPSSFDIAVPRLESSTGVGAKNVLIQTHPTLTLEQDLSRRDATMNAMAIRVRDILSVPPGLQSILVVDPENGVEHIRQKRGGRSCKTFW